MRVRDKGLGSGFLGAVPPELRIANASSIFSKAFCPDFVIPSGSCGSGLDCDECESVCESGAGLNLGNSIVKFCMTSRLGEISRSLPYVSVGWGILRVKSISSG